MTESVLIVPQIINTK